MSEEIAKAISNLSIEERVKLAKVLESGTSIQELVETALTNFFWALGI